MSELTREYFQNATSWESNRVALALASKRRAYVFAALLLAVCIIQSLALVGLTPLKTVQLEAIVLDRSEGTIQPLQSLKEVQVSLDDVFTKKFITDFMLARENYTYDTAELLYYTAAAFMSPALQTQWGNFWNTKNPESPLNVYKTLNKVRITINTITLHTKESGRKDLATVRFRKTITNGDVATTRAYMATITYSYVAAPTEEAVRRINPVGFMVTEYRVDDEISGLDSRKEGGNL
ncbi:MAG: type IV secretion system protein [Desulfovibrio sp.]|jgi:type IV secretion system protein VirB8|nr:type IV secretion system protein [Desulfovibrio sp.]